MKNNRKYLRVPVALEDSTLLLSKQGEAGKKVLFKALVLNSSFNGKALVVVHPEAFEVNELVAWHENDSIESLWKIVSVKNLEDQIWRLGLEIIEE